MSLGWNELLLIFIPVFVLLLLPFIFFLIAQQNTLKNIQLQHRKMNPGEVWLQLIPIFGLVWQFIVVTRISESIRRELSTNTFSFENNAAYDDFDSPKPTYSMGIAYCVLFCCSIIPLIGAIIALAGLVCWIIYWVQLSEMKNKLVQKRYSLASPPSLP